MPLKPKSNSKISHSEPFALIIVCLTMVLGFSVWIWGQSAIRSWAAPDVPQVISLQGKLTDENRITVSDSPLNMVFTIWNDETSTADINCLWTADGSCSSKDPISVTPKDGVFSVLLGDSGQNAIPDDIFTSSADRFIGIKIGSDSEMTPRIKLGSVPSAINAGLLGGFLPSQSAGESVVLVTTASGDIYLTAATDDKAFFVYTDTFLSRNATGDLVFDDGVYSGPITLSQLAAGPSNAFIQGGNSFGANAILGTNDNHPLSFETNNSTRMTIDTSGKVGIGTANPSAKLNVAGAKDATTDVSFFGVPESSWGGHASSDWKSQAINTFAAYNSNRGSGTIPLFILGQTDQNASEVYGSVSMAEFLGSSATADRVIGSMNAAVKLAAGSAQDMMGTYSAVVGMGGGIENSYGHFISVSSNATNSYGLAIQKEAGFLPGTYYGIYESGSDTKNYFAGATGIGTDTPTNFKLQVAGHVGPNADDTYDLGSSSYRWRDLYLGPSSLHLGVNGNEAVIGYSTIDNKLLFKPDGTNTRLVIEDAGNVGIGTTSPTNKLHVVPPTGVNGIYSYSPDKIAITGDSDTDIAILGFSSSNGWGVWAESDSGYAIHATTNTGYAGVFMGGNVGIGTATPTNFKLQVAGHVGPNADDTYDLGSSSYRWRDLYLGPSSLHIGSSSNESTLTYSTTDSSLIFKNSANSISGFQFQKADNTPILRINTTNERVLIGSLTPQPGRLAVSRSDSGVAIYADNNFNNTSATGVFGASTYGTGVIGSSDSRYGIYGLSESGIGVYGSSEHGVGIQATSNSATHPSLLVSVGASGPAAIFEGGSVGIGTTTPNSLLTVEGVLALAETTEPSETANYGKFYVKSSDNLPYFKTGVGVEYPLIGATNAFVQGGNEFSANAVLGTKDDNPLIFITHNNEKARIDITGNVGIGTTTPSARLDVVYADTNTFAANTTYGSKISATQTGSINDPYRDEELYGLYVTSAHSSTQDVDSLSTYGGYFSAVGNTATGGSGAYGLSAAVSGASVNQAGRFVATGGTSGTHYGVYASTSGDSGSTTYGLYANSLGISTNKYGVYVTGENQNYFSGKVGIGTTDPATPLNIRSADPVGFGIDQLLLQGSATTGAVDSGSGMTFGGNNGSLWMTWAMIQGKKENSTIGNNAGYFRIGTRPAGGSMTERMRIDSNGYVGIGTSTPNDALDVVGNIDISSGSAYKINNNNVLFVSNSDTNTHVGIDAGENISSGTLNTFLGKQAGLTNATGDRNTFLGSGAGYFATSSNNTFVGASSGFWNSSGAANTALGMNAGLSNSTGNANTMIGSYAGYTNTAHYNTFVGAYGGYSNSSGTYNTFLGFESGYRNTTSSFNTYIGYLSGRYLLGANNLTIGYQAGKGSLASTTTDAINNVFIGNNAGSSITTGNQNTVLGYYAGTGLTSGSNNILIGYGSGALSLSSGSKNIIIGEYDVESLAPGTSNQLFISNGDWDLIKGLMSPTAGWLSVQGDLISHTGVLRAQDGVLFNEFGSANSDFRVQSDNNTHMIFADASLDAVGINTSVPQGTFGVNGSAVFNQNSSSAYDFTVKSASNPNMLFVDASANRVGIGTNPSYRFHSVDATNQYMSNRFEKSGTSTASNFLIYAENQTTYTETATSGKWGMQIQNTGTWNGHNYGLQVDNLSTSTTGQGGGMNKMGIKVASTGTWSTATTNNYGIYSEANGATSNWGIYASSSSASGGAPAIFNRLANDGVIVSLRQAGTEEGTISVSGTTVSYNAFTGSHYATAAIEPVSFSLVSLTGNNDYPYGGGEVLYGITESTFENDPKVLGAYLSLLSPQETHSNQNPYLVMSVGNGDLWVVDEGKDIEAGDYLISSNTKGHARLDSETGSVSYVIARAGEKIDWSTVTEIASNGKKHKKISVLFEPFQKFNIAVFDRSATMDKSAVATETETGKSSHGLTFRGSGWNAGTATADNVEMTLVADVTDSDNYSLSIKNTAGTQVAMVANTGDLAIAGKLYPSALGQMQTDAYIYYGGATDDYMRTNASGWGTGSYDFAEMFPSNEILRPGELVVFAAQNEHVRKSAAAYDRKLAGIVSTKPGFLAGNKEANTYPVALAGRVPTKVNLEGGAIEVGDPITSSSAVGVGMKAAQAGQIVGYALEPYSGLAGQSGYVIVFVSPGYYPGTGADPQAGQDNSISGGVADLTALNMYGDIYMYGNRIVDVGVISGLAGRFSLDAQGNLQTQGAIYLVTSSHQGEKVESPVVAGMEHKITLDGTGQIQNGTAIINFEDVSPRFNDIISTSAPIRVVVTANGPANLYVSAKDNNGFTVEQIGGRDSGISFDWLVTAYRKDYEPEEVIEEPPAEEPPAQEPPAEEPIVEEPPVEEAIAEEPPVEEDELVLEPPVQESGPTDTEDASDPVVIADPDPTVTDDLII